ncbi:hypothetical protein ACFQ3Z_28595 [Streptomyces nogalater]
MARGGGVVGVVPAIPVGAAAGLEGNRMWTGRPRLPSEPCGSTVQPARAASAVSAAADVSRAAGLPVILMPGMFPRVAAAELRCPRERPREAVSGLTA